MSFEDEPIDEVGDALGLTIEVLEDSISDLKAAAAYAVADERFDTIDTTTARLRWLREFAEKVTDLLEEWQRACDLGEAPPPEEARASTREVTNQEHDGERAKHRYLGRAERGSKTPQSAFRVPILAALADAGGSLQSADALDRVGERMHALFSPVDLSGLPSLPDEPRWRNTARWARNDLANDGYIDRSVYGRWTITAAGREWLARQP